MAASECSSLHKTRLRVKAKGGNVYMYQSVLKALQDSCLGQAANTDRRRNITYQLVIKTRSPNKSIESRPKTVHVKSNILASWLHSAESRVKSPRKRVSNDPAVLSMPAT